MPRARNIKPGFFANELLGEIPPLGRLLFAGIWTIADRKGRLEDRASKIKAAVLPYDKCDAEKLLRDLASRGFILRYEVDGRRLIQVVNWERHQNPHIKEQHSTLPAPPEHVAEAVTGMVPEPVEHGASTVQAPCEHGTSTEVALKLPGWIPGSLDSLIPGSLEEQPPGASHPGSTAAPEDHQGKPSRTRRPDLEGFDAWYGAYPLKVARGAAEKAWAKLTGDERAAATVAVGLFADAYRGADESRRQFIPHPATWLNAKRWSDDPAVWRREAATPTNGRNGSPVARPTFTRERPPSTFADLDHEEV